MKAYATAREMLTDLCAKKISARELLKEHVARNEPLQKRLNAVVATDLARAEKDAAAIDDARARGKTLGPLAGLPMTIKDGLDVEGMPAVCGNPAYADRDKNCADATVVKRARAAGAIIWGKTNVPLQLGDFQTFNAVYGTTNNPYDVTRTPGGSSGGAAAALATDVTPLEIGSDIGGSLRHPANYCGVMSVKPTWNALDPRGHIPPAPHAYMERDFNVVGPMARNGEDLKLLWSVLRGTPAVARRDIRNARVAVWDEEPGWALASDVRAALGRAADALSRAGAKVERTKPQISGEALMQVYTALLTAAIIPDFPQEMVATFEETRPADLKAAREGKLDAFGAYRLRFSISHREVLSLMVRRQAMKDKLAEFFASHDAILMPVGMVPPFKHVQDIPFQDRMLDVDGKSVAYADMLNWIAPATALHAPSIAVPAGQTRSGLPVGVQIVGPWHGEDRLFDYAAAIEEALGGFTPPRLD
jgi:amidase